MRTVRTPIKWAILLPVLFFLSLSCKQQTQSDASSSSSVTANQSGQNTRNPVVQTPVPCIANSTKSCSENNGAGTKKCNPQGTDYGQCVLTSCNSGYTLQSNGTCVSNTTSKPVVAAQGQILGSCMYQLDGAFKPATTPSANDITWPMLSCNSLGVAACATGFKVINETPVQMNCASDPSANLSNCYWATKKCVRTTGSKDLSNFVKGQVYGGCLTQHSENFTVKAIDYIAWPMVSCDTAGNTVCAAGFKPIKDAPVQMNCSSTPSKTNTLNCYWLTTRCVKN